MVPHSTNSYVHINHKCHKKYRLHLHLFLNKHSHQMRREKILMRKTTAHSSKIITRWLLATFLPFHTAFINMQNLSNFDKNLRLEKIPITRQSHLSHHTEETLDMKMLQQFKVETAPCNLKQEVDRTYCGECTLSCESLQTMQVTITGCMFARLLMEESFAFADTVKWGTLPAAKWALQGFLNTKRVPLHSAATAGKNVSAEYFILLC